MAGKSSSTIFGVFSGDYLLYDAEFDGDGRGKTILANLTGASRNLEAMEMLVSLIDFCNMKTADVEASLPSATCIFEGMDRCGLVYAKDTLLQVLLEKLATHYGDAEEWSSVFALLKLDGSCEKPAVHLSLISEARRAEVQSEILIMITQAVANQESVRGTKLVLLAKEITSSGVVVDLSLRSAFEGLEVVADPFAATVTDENLRAAIPSLRKADSPLRTIVASAAGKKLLAMADQGRLLRLRDSVHAQQAPTIAMPAPLAFPEDTLVVASDDQSRWESFFAEMKRLTSKSSPYFQKVDRCDFRVLRLSPICHMSKTNNDGPSLHPRIGHTYVTTGHTASIPGLALSSETPATFFLK